MKKRTRFLVKGFGAVIMFFVLLFIIGYFAAWGNYSVPKTVEYDSSLPQIKLGNTLFHCETFGDVNNSVVIVLHGGPGDDYKNLLSLKALFNEYFVVFYDQRGAGLSMRTNPNLLTIETYVNDLHMFVKEFGKVIPVNLVGHSWGAMLASKYISTYPELVNKVVLAEPGFLNTEMMNKFIEKTGGFEPKITPSLIYYMTKTFFKMLHVDAPDEQARMDFFMLSLMTEPMDDNPILNYFCNKKPSDSAFDKWRFGSAASMVAMNMLKNPDGKLQFDMVSGIEKFKRKVLFMASECNTILGEEHQREHMKLFPNSEIVIVKNAGHLMFGERPKKSVAIVRTYLNEKI